MPAPHLYERWMKQLSIFICGAIVGSAGFTAIYHRNFNELAIINVHLREQVVDLQQMVDEYEKSRKKTQRDTSIRNVRIIVEAAPDQEPLNDLAKVDLANRIQKDLRAFVGMKPDPEHLYIQIETARSVLNGKIYPDVRGQDYRVHMRMAAFIQPELRIWVTTSLYSAKP